MKILLRSCVIFHPSDAKDLLLDNYFALRQSGLEFDVVPDQVLWTHIQEFVRAYNHVPDSLSIRHHFELIREDEVVKRLAHLSSIQCLTRGDFVARVIDLAEQRRTRLVGEMLKEAAEIVATGREFRRGKEVVNLKGPQAAVKYILDKSHDLVAPALGGKLSGEVTRDGTDFKAEYTRVAEDPRAGMGQHTGLDQMDFALNGAKRHELWIHAGFTGGFKSQFIMNWAYNQAIWYRWNSLIFSLEMPYHQVRRNLYAIHSSHRKFAAIRHKLGLQKDPYAMTGLPYTEMRDGTLEAWHPNAKKFLFDYVIPDMNGNLVITGNDPETGEPWGDPAHYGKIHIEVADPEKNDFTMADLRQRSELLYSQSPFHSLFIDHAGLMSPRKWVSSTTDRLNEVIRDSKRLAMSFNRGQGMAVVALFQINREGWRSAQKAKEKSGTAKYDLTHLSYANECLLEGTLIPTDQGWIPVEAVPVGAQVWSSSGWKEVLSIFDQGTRPTWVIQTDRGAQLVTTGDHRVRVVTDQGLAWKETRQLSPADFVVGGSDLPVPRVRAKLPPLTVAKYEKASGEQGTPIRVPSQMTHDLAYLLGAWDGDGKRHPQGLGWTGNRKETQVREALQDAFLRTFGHALSNQEAPSRPGSFDLFKWSQPLKRWFDEVSGERGVVVPEAVLRSPSLVPVYLRGLFDTDGWINVAGVVGLKMKGACLSFVRTIQTLLQGLGIDSHLKEGAALSKVTGKTYPFVNLRVRSRLGRERFANLIGFTENAKSTRLMTFVQKGGESQKRGDVQMYPVPETFLRVLTQVQPFSSARLYNLRSSVRKTGLVSRGAIESVLQGAHGLSWWDSDLEYLRLLVEDLQVTRVHSVTPERESHVWDLEVGGDHEYQTGPLLSHNCERSADIVTTSYLDPDLSRANRIQFQCLKSRDQKPFETFVARVEWPCKRLLTCNDPVMTSQQQDAVGSQLDSIKALDV